MKKHRELLLGSLILFGLFFGAWQLISNFYQQQVISQQEIYLEKKGALLIDLSDDLQDINQLEQLSNAYLDSADERITLIDANSNIIFDTYNEQLTGDERDSRPEIQAVLKGADVGIDIRMSATLDQELLYVAIPTYENNELQYILRLSETTESFVSDSEPIKQSIFVVYLILCSLIFLALAYFFRQRNRPIETILPVLKKMIHHPDQQELILQTANDTYGSELYQTINILSEQLSQTYQAYSATEKQLFTLLNELMIGVFIVENDGTLVMMNPTMKEQLGIYSALEEQLSFTEVIKDTQLIKYIYRINEETPLIHKEITLTEPIERVLDINLRHFNDQRQILCISYDLTRVRQLEKMQQDFVGNVSHELKTPVTSLIGFTETLLDGAKDDPDTLHEFLLIMQKDAHRLERLIQEIIQLSKGSQLMQYETQPIDVNHLLEQLVIAYQPTLTKKTISIKIDGPQGIFWHSKVELFAPIIKNLVENAIQYSPDHQDIEITFSVDTHFQLSVKDYGVGIDPDDQVRIFERFYRVDKDRSRHSGGTGLGLAIVKDYTERLGGEILIDSHPGVGSTFTLQLPQLNTD
ncbi:MAG: ATP-binding protein [Enterococcus sp.]